VTNGGGVWAKGVFARFWVLTMCVLAGGGAAFGADVRAPGEAGYIGPHDGGRLVAYGGVSKGESGTQARPEEAQPSIFAKLRAPEGGTNETASGIRGWTVGAVELSIHFGGEWYGSVKDENGQRVWIYIYADPKRPFHYERFRRVIDYLTYGNPEGVPENVHELEVEGAGKVLFSVDEARPGRGVQRPAQVRVPPDYGRVFYWTKDGQYIILDSSIGRFYETGERENKDTAKLSEEEKKAITDKAREEAVSAAAQDPAVGLLKAMASDDPVLMRTGLATDYPRVEASVDGAQYEELRKADKFKGADCGWTLDARAGQKVSFRVRFPAGLFVVTGHGIMGKEDAGALAGQSVRMREKPDLQAKRGTGTDQLEEGWVEAQIGKDGAATIEYGAIRSGQPIQFSFTGWRKTGQAFLGQIILSGGEGEKPAGGSGARG